MPTVHAVSLHGLTGHLIALTATSTPSADGAPALVLTGAVGRDDRDLRDRVRAALANSGHPNRRRSVQVHIDPLGAPPPAVTADAATVAAAVIAASSTTTACRLAGTAVLGELGLDGSLRPIRGVLPAVQAARAHGIRQVIVPNSSLAEAALVDDVDVFGAGSLTEVADWLHGRGTLAQPGTGAAKSRTEDRLPVGRLLAAPVLRAVEVAAAGGHHMVLHAVEGAGSMLVACWLHQLLPDLTPAQQLEVAAIRSLTDSRDDGAVLVSTPPVATVHYSCSLAMLAGGATPGAVTRAHHGLLVAPDLDEFTTSHANALRGALHYREIVFARGGYPLAYPARFQLVATSTSTPNRRRPRLERALLDAIDIRLRLTTPQAAIGPRSSADDTEQVGQVLVRARTRVVEARARAAARWTAAEAEAGAAVESGGDVEITNAAVPAAVLRAYPLPAEVVAPIHRALEVGALSRRGADTVDRLTWTLADLDGADLPGRHHVEEALQLRQASGVASAATPPKRTGDSATDREVR